MPGSAAAISMEAPDAAAGPGRPLDAGVRNWFEPRFGRDLSGLVVHDDAYAAAVSRSLGARAVTQGRDLFFGTREYAPDTDRGRWLIAHEIAHAFQACEPGLVACKTLLELSRATRRKLKISRTAPPEDEVKSWVKKYFDPKSGTAMSVSTGDKVEFGPGITDKDQQKGLHSIAAELYDMSEAEVNPDPESRSLPVDAILDFALDLRPQGGEHAVFRFTRYATKGKASTVLIEKLRVLAPAPARKPGPAPARKQVPVFAGGKPAQVSAGGATLAPGPTAAREAAHAVSSFTGEVQVGSVKIKIDQKFSDSQGKMIADAVRLLPDPIRAKVDGVSFAYVGTGKGPGDQNGEYDQEHDTVRIWKAMFDPSLRWVGEVTFTAYQIVHELGHVIDQRPLYKAQREHANLEERMKALTLEQRKAETKTFKNDPLYNPYEDPQALAEMKRIQEKIDQVKKEREIATKGMATAKSIAGHEVRVDEESMLTDFAKAIKADGVKAVPDAKVRNRDIDAANEAAAQKASAAGGAQPTVKSNVNELDGGISNYAQKNLMEAFAENFAFYMLDEPLFKAIRPKTHAFFAKKFPKTVLPKKTRRRGAAR